MLAIAIYIIIVAVVTITFAFIVTPEAFSSEQWHHGINTVVWLLEELEIRETKSHRLYLQNISQILPHFFTSLKPL